jgi:hypothetical protein
MFVHALKLHMFGFEELWHTFKRKPNDEAESETIIVVHRVSKSRSENSHA